MSEITKEQGPSCSMQTENLKIPNEELIELNLEQGINVWGTNQQTLEEQAEQELDIFAQNITSVVPSAEDGEIVEPKQQVFAALDINSYIKRQEELRRIQEYKRTLLVSSKSKSVADEISERQLQRRKVKKCKKKRGEKRRIEEIKEVESVPEVHNGSDSDYVPSEAESETDYEPLAKKSKRHKPASEPKSKIKTVTDDGDLKLYQMRLEEHYKHLETEHSDDDELEYEYYTIKGGLKIPFTIWNKLYSYQQDGVRWLWNTHQKCTGGILGDEMGLGKTVQVIAFLRGLDYTQVVSKGGFKGLGPSLIVSPATVIHQWVKHFHEWAPEFRVAILHQSGSYHGNKAQLIRDMNQSKGILVTSYEGVLKYKEQLHNYNWHYVILDEGHKIRNPQAKITKEVKKFGTAYKLMLTGSPMQNNLLELWSLFDFTNPGMLGSLQAFTEHFNNPIVQGGFTNSTPMQEATALSVATTLKDLITPFLLRRTKSQVQDAICLPVKTEQVLFCSLSEEQKDLYKGYLMGDFVGSIMGKDTKGILHDNPTRARILVGITTLRKICNHPDIYLNQSEDTQEAESDSKNESLAPKFGHYKKSGKMIVVSALLKMWKKQKHRTLLFSQSRLMMVIFERFLSEQGYKYLKMDGGTSVTSRQPLIEKFNADESYDVFLLTTRVGGLGINLTGADRVIIYDPDWNPATDIQARERAWRIGQNKKVTIYRLLSAGTIEEKMYQRQVWKQLLCNKVLIDPKTHRFFKNSNLHDLFSLTEQANPESTNIFRESRIKIEEKLQEKKSKNVQFSESKLKEMKDRAQQIAKSLNKTEEKCKTQEELEFEEERAKKKHEKEQLKKLSAPELFYLNREKLKQKCVEPNNTVDGCDTGMSFEKALEMSQDNAHKYSVLKSEPLKDTLAREKTKQRKAIKIDTSGKINGEVIDGLVKRETQKVRAENKTGTEKTSTVDSHDNYVLEKLFAKGVSGALHHDSIVEGGVKNTSLRVECEAKMRADKALEALRKSRVDSWRW